MVHILWQKQNSKLADVEKVIKGARVKLKVEFEYLNSKSHIGKGKRNNSGARERTETKFPKYFTYRQNGSFPLTKNYASTKVEEKMKTTTA